MYLLKRILSLGVNFDHVLAAYLSPNSKGKTYRLFYNVISQICNREDYTLYIEKITNHILPLVGVMADDVQDPARRKQRLVHREGDGGVGRVRGVVPHGGPRGGELLGLAPAVLPRPAAPKRRGDGLPLHGKEKE